MDYVELLSALDANPVLHKSRIIILLYAFAEEPNSSPIEGIPKLAKLDYFLQYPNMLRRALEAKGISAKGMQLQNYEANSVEAEWAQYRFGPWEHSYRLYLNLLVGEGLIKMSNEGKEPIISLTEKGFHLGKELCKEPTLSIYRDRAILLKRHFNLTSTNLMRFIYSTFPEIISLNPEKREP